MIATRNQEKKKQKGRPTVAEARRLSKAVTVKFSKKDYEILRIRSRKANRRLAEYIESLPYSLRSYSPIPRQN